MNKKLKTALIITGGLAALLVACLAVVVAFFLTPTNTRDNQNPARQKEMVQISLQVGDLAPIPKAVHITTVKTEGNSFTRSFRVEFNSDAKTIKKWLADSGGISTAKSEKEGNSIKYVLKPKLNYNYADVIVDNQFRSVRIYVSSN